MKKKRKHLPGSRTDWALLDSMTNEEVLRRALADPDAQPTTKADWKRAYQPNLPGKESITIRIDRGVVSFFRSRPGRYQTHINAALREYMDECRRGERPLPGAIRRAKPPARRAAEARAGFRGKRGR
jgi:uncharacterized protein (DUF4415 family)